MKLTIKEKCFLCVFKKTTITSLQSRRNRAEFFFVYYLIIKYLTCVSVPVTIFPTLRNAGTISDASSLANNFTKFCTQPASMTA